jgi:hypothetical protein
MLVKEDMKNRVYSALVTVALTLAAANVASAKSELVSLSAAPMWPTSSTPDNSLVYNVTTVARAGSGLLQVTLTASALPPGVTVTFSPAVLRFTGNQVTSQTALMIVHCPSPLPLDSYPFVITGTSANGTISVTNQVTISAQDVANRVATLSLIKQTGSSMQLRGLGATAKTYQIQGRASLTDPAWTTLTTATADGNGRFVFNTTQNGPTYFYRAVDLGQ